MEKQSRKGKTEDDSETPASCNSHSLLDSWGVKREPPEKLREPTGEAEGPPRAPGWRKPIPRRAGTCTAVLKERQLLQGTEQTSASLLGRGAAAQPRPCISSLPPCIQLLGFPVSSQAQPEHAPLPRPCLASPRPASDLVPLPALRAQSAHPSRALAQ